MATDAAIVGPSSRCRAPVPGVFDHGRKDRGAERRKERAMTGTNPGALARWDLTAPHPSCCATVRIGPGPRR
jgi:hypothetical protein